MGIKGVAAWVGGVAGGLVLAGVAGFYLMPRACGCGPVVDPTIYVGKGGAEISEEAHWCSHAPLELPREDLTWWTVAGDPVLTSEATGEYLVDTYEVEAVPYGETDSPPRTIEVRVQPDMFGLPAPPATAELHLAVTPDGVVPFGIVTTTWDAALFVDRCAEDGLRDPVNGPPLTDAEVADFPSLSQAELEALYGPPPAAPRPITAEALGAREVLTAGQDVAIGFLGYGDVPSGDSLSLVIADGVLNSEPITGLNDDYYTEVTGVAEAGQLLGVVLNRDGQHYLLGTVTLPQATFTGPLYASFDVDYREVQSVAPLSGGSVAEVPTVLLRPFNST